MSQSERHKKTDAPAGFGKKIEGNCILCGKPETRDNPLCLVGLPPKRHLLHDECWVTWYKEKQSGL